MHVHCGCAKQCRFTGVALKSAQRQRQWGRLHDVLRRTEESSQPVCGSPVRETRPPRLPGPCHHCCGRLCLFAASAMAVPCCSMTLQLFAMMLRFVRQVLCKCLAQCNRGTLHAKGVSCRASKHRLRCRATGPSVEASTALPGHGAERRSIGCTAEPGCLTHGSRRQVRGVARLAASQPPAPGAVCGMLPQLALPLRPWRPHVDACTTRNSTFSSGPR